MGLKPWDVSLTFLFIYFQAGSLRFVGRAPVARGSALAKDVNAGCANSIDRSFPPSGRSPRLSFTAAQRRNSGSCTMNHRSAGVLAFF